MKIINTYIDSHYTYLVIETKLKKDRGNMGKKINDKGLK